MTKRKPTRKPGRQTTAPFPGSRLPEGVLPTVSGCPQCGGLVHVPTVVPQAPAKIRRELWYKVLDPSLRPRNGGQPVLWHPARTYYDRQGDTRWRPGHWTWAGPGPLAMCSHGLHLTPPWALPKWLGYFSQRKALVVAIAEPAGECLYDWRGPYDPTPDHKLVCQYARLHKSWTLNVKAVTALRNAVPVGSLSPRASSFGLRRAMATLGLPWTKAEARDLGCWYQARRNRD